MHRATWLIPAVLIAMARADGPSPAISGPETANPIAALDTVFLEEMTWLEVRDALGTGKDTAIVATGGVEQNGPYVATGKHNYVLRATTEAIARKLGNTLVAPIVPFVPEGNVEPPTGHMKYPGTISVTEETYRRLVAEICASLRAHGFRRIVLIGDSGGNQAGLKAVAADLNTRWEGDKSRVFFIPEYYNPSATARWLEGQGIHQVDEGFHDDLAIEATLMTVSPTLVRAEQRIASKRFRINGVELAPADRTIDLGRRIVDHRAEVTVGAIRRAFSEVH